MTQTKHSATRRPPRSPGFDAQATQVIERVKDSFAALLAALPGGGVERAVGLARALDIDNRLAWKVFRLTESNDPFAAAQYLPGAGGVMIVLRAAAKHKLPAPLIKSAERSFASYCAFARQHGGNRRGLEKIMAGHAVEDRARSDVEQRRQMSAGAAYVWGIEARVCFQTNIFQPSANGLSYDIARIRGFVDVRRLRPNVAWRLARLYSVDGSYAVRTADHWEPVEPLGEGPGPRDDPPLLPEFCSRPLPEFRRATFPDGVVEHQLRPGPVGNAGAVTWVAGEVVRDVESRYRTTEYPSMGALCHVRMACACVVFDLMLDRELFGPITPHLELFSDLFAGHDLRYQECDRLPIHEQVERLSVRPEQAQMQELPFYPALMRYVFERLGWDSARFDVFRVRQQYPAVPTALSLEHPLPDRPNGAQRQSGGGDLA